MSCIDKMISRWNESDLPIEDRLAEALFKLERMHEDRLMLNQRIHNQRIALHENWKIIEMRASYRRAWYPSPLLRSIMMQQHSASANLVEKIIELVKPHRCQITEQADQQIQMAIVPTPPTTTPTMQEIEMTWFELKGDSRLSACASDGCGGQPTWRLEANGVGSNYCSGCKAQIERYDEKHNQSEPADNRPNHAQRKQYRTDHQC